jgi:hypothetical protein
MRTMRDRSDRRPRPPHPGSGWRPVPAGVLAVTDMVTRDDRPVYRVACPCGARLFIDDAGPGPCSRCRRWQYRIALAPDGTEVVERAPVPPPTPRPPRTPDPGGPRAAA